MANSTKQDKNLFTYINEFPLRNIYLFHLIMVDLFIITFIHILNSYYAYDNMNFFARESLFKRYMFLLVLIIISYNLLYYKVLLAKQWQIIPFTFQKSIEGRFFLFLYGKIYILHMLFVNIFLWIFGNFLHFTPLFLLIPFYNGVIVGFNERKHSYIIPFSLLFGCYPIILELMILMKHKYDIFSPIKGGYEAIKLHLIVFSAMSIIFGLYGRDISERHERMDCPR
jgi:hypothetical protein